MFSLERPDHAVSLIVAVVLGALIGLERRARGHVAGLHTNALVSLGAAAYVVIADLAGDPTAIGRVVGQIVTGVGFLGAGVIMQHRGSIIGLNTAAMIWCTAAVGALAGSGRLTWSVLLAALAIGANAVLHIIEHGLFRGDPDTH